MTLRACSLAHKDRVIAPKWIHKSFVARAFLVPVGKPLLKSGCAKLDILRPEHNPRKRGYKQQRCSSGKPYCPKDLFQNQAVAALAAQESSVIVEGIGRTARRILLIEAVVPWTRHLLS